MSSLFGAYDPTQGTYSASQISAPAASTSPAILDAEQAARQATLNLGMGPGYAQGVDPSVYQTLYSTNAQGQVVRNSDGYVAPWSANQIQNPNAQQYYQQNPQELFALGALGGGGGQGYFMDAGVRGTNLKYGQLNPDQWYQGYTSNFADGWDQNVNNGYRWAGQDSQPVGQNKAGGTMNAGVSSGGNVGSSGGSAGVSGGGYGGASGGSSSTTTTTQPSNTLNPYLTQAQQALTQQATDNLNRNILPGISSSAASTGNFGGSRQGVVEANAIRDLNQQITNGMAGLSYNAYNSALNAGLQQQSIDNSYNLGLGNLNLGYKNSDNNFYTAQRGQDLQSTALGAQLLGQSNQNYLNAGTGISNVGTSIQQAPWQTIGNFNNTVSPYTGFGSTTTNSQNANPWAQALGGAALGSQIGKLW